MSATAPPDPILASPTASKKKKNKKKKNASNKGDTNGDSGKIDEFNKDGDLENDEGEGDEDVETASVVNSGKNESEISTDPTARVNGGDDEPIANGHANATAQKSPTKPHTKGPSEETMESNASDTSDASSRLEAMSQDREALRAEVEKMRKALEDIQGKHDEEMTAIREELEESQNAKEQAQTQYQNLLGRVNTIKSSLGERLAADRQELAEAKEQIEELDRQNEDLTNGRKVLEAEITQLTKDSEETSKELSDLRNRYNLSQQNWVMEREDLLNKARNLKEEGDAAKEAMGDWEVLAMEERSIRENLTERMAELEEQMSSHREAYERAVSERDSQSQAVEGLQRALQEIQEARKQELREMVETSQEQTTALKKLVQESDARAVEAEKARDALQKEVERTAPFEKEIKEKNLLIGKLRHEAIVLNEHLTKALRFLKKAKPEDNIDRQIVTNHFLHFITLDRSDPKKFQVLQLIAALLNWNEEQREQAGLARPGALSTSLRPPTGPFHRTPSTPTLSTEFFQDNASKESLAELWTGFLERQAEEGSRKGSRSDSMSSVPPLPPPKTDTK